jgi:hypothetical protein
MLVFGKYFRGMNKFINQGSFAVVNVGNNGNVTNILIHYFKISSRKGTKCKAE